MGRGSLYCNVPAVPERWRWEQKHLSFVYFLPSCTPQSFPISIYSSVESEAIIISQKKKHTSGLWRNLLNGTLRRLEHGERQPQRTADLTSHEGFLFGDSRVACCGRDAGPAFQGHEGVVKRCPVARCGDPATLCLTLWAMAWPSVEGGVRTSSKSP